MIRSWNLYIIIKKIQIINKARDLWWSQTAITITKRWSCRDPLADPWSGYWRQPLVGLISQGPIEGLCMIASDRENGAVRNQNAEMCTFLRISKKRMYGNLQQIRVIISWARIEGVSRVMQGAFMYLDPLQLFHLVKLIILSIVQQALIMSLEHASVNFLLKQPT